MKPPKQYGIYNTDDVDCHYWELYDRLEDAVQNRSGVEVYEFVPKFLGEFKLTAKLVKVKKKKDKK